jgi:hypothetical protein
VQPLRSGVFLVIPTAINLYKVQQQEPQRSRNDLTKQSEIKFIASISLSDTMQTAPKLSESTTVVIARY